LLGRSRTSGSLHIVKDNDMKERLFLEVERLSLSAVIMGAKDSALRNGGDEREGVPRLSFPSRFLLLYLVVGISNRPLSFFLTTAAATQIRHHDIMTGIDRLRKHHCSSSLKDARHGRVPHDGEFRRCGCSRGWLPLLPVLFERYASCSLCTCTIGC
jgi:hypothetical protein